MNWYDGIAKDPQGSLQAAAKRQGLSVDALELRYQKVIDLMGDASGVEHLSLLQLQQVQQDQKMLSPLQLQHIDQCEYCQVLSDAIAPAMIDAQVNEIVDRVGVWDEGREKDASTHWVSLKNLIARPFALPAGGVLAGILATLFIGGTGGALYVNASDSEMAEYQMAVVVGEGIQKTPPLFYFYDVNVASASPEKEINSLICSSQMTLSGISDNTISLTWNGVGGNNSNSACHGAEKQLKEFFDKSDQSSDDESIKVGQNIDVVLPIPASK